MDALQWIGEFLAIVGDHAPVLVGFLLPPVIEVLSRDVKREDEQVIFSFIVCFVSGAILHWREFGTSPLQVFLWIGLVYTESNVLFKLYFKRSNVRLWIKEKTQGSPMNTPMEGEGYLEGVKTDQYQ